MAKAADAVPRTWAATGSADRQAFGVGSAGVECNRKLVVVPIALHASTLFY